MSSAGGPSAPCGRPPPSWPSGRRPWFHHAQRPKPGLALGRRAPRLWTVRGQREHRHLSGSVVRVAAIVAVGAILVPAVIVETDLLVLPAVALVLLAWLTIALVAL